MSGASRTYGIVGLGLIGGSLARALRRAEPLARIVGVDSNDDHRRDAMSMGLADEVSAGIEPAASVAEVVVIATPPSTVAALARAALAHAAPGAVVTDVASTKRLIVEAIDDPRFVGAHPIAGTEKSGPSAADSNLFDGRVVIVVPGRATTRAAVDAVEAMWRRVGARTVTMDATLHDRVVAAVSHLPHAVAYSLTDAIGRLGDALPMLYGLGAGGFQDTTRIASSNPVMWRDIFIDNRAEALAAIDAFLVSLREIRAAIDRGDAAAMERVFERAREIRRRVLETR